jgi:cytoskeletal protein CcmA (bactofilin family)
MAERDLTGIGELQALLGQGTEFEGKLVFEGRVRIDGKFKGEIWSEDVLILGPTAEVRANVEVGTLIVRGGALWGDVRARRLVEIYAPARVHGTIESPQMFLDKGASFDGTCTMPEDRPAGRSEAPSVEPAKARE